MGHRAQPDQEFFAGEGAREQRARCSRWATASSRSSRSRAPTSPGSRQPAPGWANGCMTPARLARRGVNVSFRSTSPVLALVDACSPTRPRRRRWYDRRNSVASRRPRRHAGRVELWPLAEAPPPEPPAPWTAPSVSTRHLRAPVAGGRSGGLDPRPDRRLGAAGKQGRPLQPRDVMILVRRRDALPAALVRSLKSLGVPVADWTACADRATRRTGSDGALRRVVLPQTT